jgi:hypothetical protein
MALRSPAIDFERIAQLDADDLERLCAFVRERLRAARCAHARHNLLSVRLPLAICDDIRHRAQQQHTTPSSIVREALRAWAAASLTDVSGERRHRAQDCDG